MKIDFHRNVFIQFCCIFLMMIKRSVSIAEFFSKNKQFLGYVNPQRSLFTVVKELLDNALDIVEESRVENPTVKIEVRNVKNDIYLVKCEDNGAGIEEKDVPYVFCKFLFGHKFLEKKQTRGQQGIGVSSVVLYAQQSTGNPVRVITKTKNSNGHEFKLMIDVKKNEPIIIEKKKVEKESTGTTVEVLVKGRYSERIDEYIRRTALVNPHVTIEFNGKVYKSRDKMPEISSIPVMPADLDYVEFKELIKNTHHETVRSFIYHSFRGIGWERATIIENKIGKREVKELTEEEIRKLYLMLKEIKLRMTFEELEKSVFGFGVKTITEYLKQFKPEKIFVRISKPELYKNEVYLVEVGCGYGVGEEINIHRFANRMPLLYTPGACLITQTVNSIKWKYYKVKRGMILLVHIASTHIPYSEQSKDAIAENEFLRNKILQCLRYIGREIKKWETYKEKEMYLKKLEKDYKELGKVLDEM